MAQWVGRWLVIERSRVRLPASPLPSNNSGQVVHTHVPLSPSSTSQRAVTLCSWEGNRRSGVALVSGLSTYGLNGLDREMSTPPTLRRGTARFQFLVPSSYYSTGLLTNDMIHSDCNHQNY